MISDEDQELNEEQQVQDSSNRKSSQQCEENNATNYQSEQKNYQQRQFDPEQRKLQQVRVWLDNEKLRNFIKAQQNELILYIFGMHHSVRKQEIFENYQHYNLKEIRELDKGTYLLEFYKKDDAINFINSDKKVFNYLIVIVLDYQRITRENIPLQGIDPYYLTILVLKKNRNEGQYQQPRQKYNKQHQQGNYKQYQTNHREGYNRKQQVYNDDNKFNELKEEFKKQEEEKKEQEKKIYKPIKFINRRKEKEKQEKNEQVKNQNMLGDNQIKQENKLEAQKEEAPTEKQQEPIEEKKIELKVEKAQEPETIQIQIEKAKIEQTDNKQDRPQENVQEKKGKKRYPEKKKSGKHNQQIKYVPKNQGNEKQQQHGFTVTFQFSLPQSLEQQSF